MRRESITARVASKSAVLLAALVLTAISVGAQTAQYKPPGSVADRPGDDRQLLEEEMETSLWRAGPFRLNPWIGITNAAFVTNAFDTADTEPQDTDLTLTLGAGVTGIVPFGQKVFLTLEAIPQYVLWLEQDERNAFNEWYGARLYGFYNRLYVEAGASRRDAVRIVSSEVNQETNTRLDLIEALAELRIGGSFHVFAGAGLGEYSSLEDEADPRLATFSLLDREETAVRAGLRYRPRDDVLFGAGIVTSETEFASTARDLSNSGDYPFVEALYDSEKFFVTAEINFLDLEPDDPTSEFVPLSEPTWEFQLTFNPGWRLDYTPYTRRDLQYALTEGYAYFLSDRYGFRLGAILSDRWRSDAFVETGADDYQKIADTTPDREDDVVSWGLDFTFDVSKWFGLTFGYSLSTFDSNLPQNDRENGTLILRFGVSELLLGRR